MFLELFFGLVTLLFVWDYLYKKRRNDILKSGNISGPQALPLLGCALAFRNVNTENSFYFVKANKEKYGKLFRIWVLHKLNVFVMDIKHLEKILSSQQVIQKSYLYQFLESWLGSGLLLSGGKKWHARRKIITPTFHFKILEQFVEIFDQQGDVMIKKLYEKADGKTAVNIYPIVCLLALDIIAETSMGVKVHAQENPDIEYVQALSCTARIMADRFIRPSQRTEWLFRWTQPKAYRELTNAIKIMHNFTNEVIKTRHEALQKSITDGTYKPNASGDSDDIGTKKRMALLDVLLQTSVEGQPLSNEDIREEVDTFMFEGHDTTTSGISFCLYLISRHPEVQQKVIEEIHAVVGEDKTRPVHYKDIQELKYLDCVIKESLRLYPPVPAIGRQAVEDLELDGVTIPANTGMTITFYMALRDPDYFPEPLAFKPERFSTEKDMKINPFAYTPFSAGPRNCIGQKFATLEMKSTISKVLRHFELLPLGEAVRPVINLVLRSASGVNIGLKHRV